jgi:hypothetical protein
MRFIHKSLQWFCFWINCSISPTSFSYIRDIPSFAGVLNTYYNVPRIAREKWRGSMGEAMKGACDKK